MVGLSKHYGRAPDTLSAHEVQTYLAYLVKERGLSWSTLSVTVHALRFFYEVTLSRLRAHFHIPTVKTPARQPEILSRQEVARILAALPRCFSCQTGEVRLVSLASARNAPRDIAATESEGYLAQ